VAVNFKIIRTTSVTRLEFLNITPDLQDQDQDRFFWSDQTGLVLRPTVSDHITGEEHSNHILAVSLITFVHNSIDRSIRVSFSELSCKQ